MTSIFLNAVPFYAIMHLHLLVFSAQNVLSSCLNLPTSFLLARLEDVTPIMPLRIKFYSIVSQFLNSVKSLQG